MKMKNNTSKHKIYYSTIALVMLIFFVISFITNILNSIIVDVKTSFDLNLTLTGLLPFSFFIAYGVMSIPAGFLSERYSDKTLLSISFFVMMIASLLFVVFPGYAVFSLTLFSLGCCMAVLQVVINPMLRVAGGEEHFAFNSVLAQLVFGLASFTSPYLYQNIVGTVSKGTSITGFLRSLVPENLPWASLYVVFSIICFLLFLVVLFSKYPDFEKNEDEKAGDSSSYASLLKNKWTLLFFYFHLLLHRNRTRNRKLDIPIFKTIPWLRRKNYWRKHSSLFLGHAYPRVFVRISFIENNG